MKRQLICIFVTSLFLLIGLTSIVSSEESIIRSETTDKVNAPYKAHGIRYVQLGDPYWFGFEIPDPIVSEDTEVRRNEFFLEIEGESVAHSVDPGDIIKLSGGAETVGEYEAKSRIYYYTLENERVYSDWSEPFIIHFVENNDKPDIKVRIEKNINIFGIKTEIYIQNYKLEEDWGSDIEGGGPLPAGEYAYRIKGCDLDEVRYFTLENDLQKAEKIKIDELEFDLRYRGKELTVEFDPADIEGDEPLYGEYGNVDESCECNNEQTITLPSKIADRSISNRVNIFDLLAKFPTLSKILELLQIF